METDVFIIGYVICIAIEVGTILFKNKFFSLIPVIVSSILFIIIKNESWFFISLIQVCMSFIAIIVDMIFLSKRKRKNNVELIKTKIKDL